MSSFCIHCHWHTLKSNAQRHNQTLSWLLSSFHTQESQHTKAPMLLLYSEAGNCIPKALRRLREILHYVSAHPRTIFHTHIVETTVCFHAFDLDFKNHLLCVCWQCCLSVSDLTVELCFYRLHRFTCSAAGRLKDKREGVVLRGGVGELPIIWWCLSCIIPCFQMEWKCWWSHGAEQLKTERERERGEREKEKEERLPSSLVYQCKLLTRQAFPSSPSLCFRGLHFDWISILMKGCGTPKLCLNPSRNSQQLSLLLICNFCCAPVEKLMG